MRNLQPMLLSLYLHLCCYNRLFSPPPPYNTEPLEVQGVKEEEGGGCSRDAVTDVLVVVNVT